MCGDTFCGESEIYQKLDVPCEFCFSFFFPIYISRKHQGRIHRMENASSCLLSIISKHASNISLEQGNHQPLYTDHHINGLDWVVINV